jgi:predicted enzyme related to lactoylglutathione lyase
MGNKCEHIELSTDDPGAAVAFYSKVFGWKIQATPAPGGGTYHMFRNENGGGGIGGKMNPGQPTAWMPYITVKSIKTTQAQAKSLGGNPIPGFEYMSLGDMGAIGGFIDPTGAAIGLWEVGKAAAAPAPKKVAKKAPARKAAKKPAPKKAAKKPAKKKR